jgi:STE24 endopeptidase
MSEMTATRIARAATIPVAVALWLLAARWLWQTEVPGDLDPPRLQARRFFSEATLHRTARHDGFLRVDLLLSLGAGLAVLVALAVLGPRLAARLRGGPLVRGLALALAAVVAVWIARLPFGLAAQWWQRRYGLSPQSYGAWLVERLPSPGGVVATLAAVAAGMALARRLGRRWWLAATPLLVAASALLVLVQPLLGPTLHPLRRPTLAQEFRDRGVKVGVERVRKRTRTAGAEAIGVGPTRRVVFTDTILDGRFDRRALRFVAAHELAHLERHHLLKGLGWFALFALPCTWAIATLVARRGGLAEPGAVPAALLAAFCLQLAAIPVGGAIARRYEAEADWLALRSTRDPAAARRLFGDFARVNLDQPDPPRFAHLLLDDHPTLLQRIAMAEAFRRGRGS